MYINCYSPALCNLVSQLTFVLFLKIELPTLSTAKTRFSHSEKGGKIFILLPCSCPEGGIVLDPFCGRGTKLVVAKKLGRNYLGFEINPEYIA